MKRILVATGLLALASPGFAQMTGPAASSPPVSAPATQSPVPAMEPAAPAPAAVSDPKAIIASEFPTYDKDGDGSLVRAEFDTWLMALKDKSGDAEMKPADKMSWLKGAFTTADKDKSKSVTLAELTDYLTAAG